MYLYLYIYRHMYVLFFLLGKEYGSFECTLKSASNAK